MAESPFSVRATGNRPIPRAASDLEKVLPIGPSAKEVVKRQQAVMEDVSRRMAEMHLSLMKRRLPTSAFFAEYKRSLRVVQVTSTPPGSPRNVFAVQSLGRRRRATRRDNDRSLVMIYSKPRQSPDQRPAWLDVLMQYNPWTVDTLPLSPGPKEANVVFMPSTVAEVSRVRSQRQDQRPDIAKALLAAGVRMPSELRKPVKGLTDLSTFALRVEFGVGGQRSIPHWRPSHRAMRQQVEREWTKGYWGKWLWDPNFGWKSAGRKKKLPQVSFTNTLAFVPFVKKIRI